MDIDKIATIILIISLLFGIILGVYVAVNCILTGIQSSSLYYKIYFITLGILFILIVCFMLLLIKDEIEYG